MKNEKLAKAKAALILDQPFFASLLLSMPMVEDASIPTMATNGDEIRINPAFLDTLSLSETIFVLAHETLHCVFQHMYRRGTRDLNKWNIAADYVINDTLVREKIGSMLKGVLYDPQLVVAGNGNSEGVYNLLPDSPPNSGGKSQGNGTGHPGAGEPGGALDQVNDAAQDAATLSQKESEMRVKIVQAANAAKMQGKLSAGIARLVNEMTATRVDWKSVLRRFLSERAKVDLSYARPKRRYLADDIYLPSLIGEKMGCIAIAVDCSGSIRDAILEAFAAEIKAIIADVAPGMTHVLYFDTEILKQDSFGPEDAFKINAIGGGGTMFSPIFTHIDSSELNPIACVVLTDLECSDFGPAPEYPVLWASIAEGHTPFGETVLIQEGE